MRYLLAAILLFGAGIVYSQELYEVTGTVKDGENRTPLKSASVQILRNDSSLVGGELTDAQGKFSVKNLRKGNYLVKVTFLGYKPYVSSIIELAGDAKKKDLGVINLSASDVKTGEVNVTAERPTIEYKLDKKIVNVDKNIVASGGTAIDVLRTTPTVTVDIDNNITIRGQQNPTVLIDGKPSASGGTNILEQLPASIIENIEIITNPSSKYEASGTTAIINVITKRNRASGLNGMVSVNAGTNDKYNATANLNYRIGIFNFFTNADYRINGRQATGDSYREMYRYDPSSSSIITDFLDQETSRRMQFNMQNYSFGFDLMLSPKDRITLSYNGRIWEFNRREKNDYFGYRESTAIRSDSSFSSAFAKTESANYNNDFNFSYRKSFKTPGEELTFDATASQNHGASDMLLNNVDYFDAGAMDPFQKTRGSAKHNILNFQTDYALPIGPDNRFETGARAVLNDMNSYFRGDFWQDTSSNWLRDPLSVNNFDFKEWVYAAYVNYGDKLDFLSYQVGLRAEYTDRETSQKQDNQNNKKSYLSLFPTLHLSAKIDEFRQLMLSYTRRIRRPDQRVVNPFKDYSDPNNIQYGNPELNPEFINSFELGLENNWKITTFTTSLFYRRNTDVIMRYRKPVEQVGIIENTFENIAEMDSYGFEAAFTNDFTKAIKFNADFSFYRSELNGAPQETNVSANNYGWSTRGMLIMNFTKDFSVQLSADYDSPNIQPQGKYYGDVGSSLGIRKDFFDGLLTASIRVDDLLDSRRHKFESDTRNSAIINQRFYTITEMKPRSRNIFFGLTWKINAENRTPRDRRKTQESDQPVSSPDIFD